MQGESLLVIIVVGVIAGWLAGQLVRGTGYGLINDLVIGVIGAFIGGWLLPQLNIHLGAGMIAAIINATIGAVLLLDRPSTCSRRRPLGQPLGLAPVSASSRRTPTRLRRSAWCDGRRAGVDLAELDPRPP